MKETYVPPTTIVERSSDVYVTAHTAKVLLLCLEPGKERFPFVREKPSFFYRMRQDGQIEKVPKRAGDGYPGGGAEQEETPVQTMLREWGEELGTPEWLVNEIFRRQQDPTTYVSHSGWEQHPFHLFCLPITQKDIDRGLVSRPAIQDWKVENVGWAWFNDLNKTILAPPNKQRREALEAKGHMWFYHSHTIYLVALLLRICQKGLFPEKSQQALPGIVFRQISPSQCLSQCMIRMLKEESADDLLYLQLPRIIRSERLIRRAVSAASHEALDAFALKILDKMEEGWEPSFCKEMKELWENIFESRQKHKTPVFSSFEDMWDQLASGAVKPIETEPDTWAIAAEDQENDND